MNLPFTSANLITFSSVVVFVSIPFALFFGLVAVTANPLLIGFAVTLILGAALLSIIRLKPPALAGGCSV